MQLSDQEKSLVRESKSHHLKLNVKDGWHDWWDCGVVVPITRSQLQKPPSGKELMKFCRLLRHALKHKIVLTLVSLG